jgi:hypothetical protein
MDKLIYINSLGKGYDNMFIYEFYVGETEGFWMMDFNVRPSGICNLGVPEKDSYNELKILKTQIKLDLAKNSSCFSYQDCIDKIISIGYENLDSYEFYPEDGRIVLQYGMLIDDVEAILANRDLTFED